MRTVTPTPQNVLYSITASIEMAKNRKKQTNVFFGCYRKPNRPQDHPGKCLVCGQVLDMLTYPHAERCGFKSPAEQCKAGQYKHIQFRKVLNDELGGN